jgi:predicted nucleotidyltransferase
MISPDLTLTEQVGAALSELPVKHIVLFGSRARKDGDAESDVDLAVILQREEPFASFAEYRDALISLRRALAPLAARHGIDLLVFTGSEWERFQSKNSAFSREIACDGVSVG